MPTNLSVQPSSAGVYFTEKEIPRNVKAANTVPTGVIVGWSPRGPVLKATKITSVPELINIFGKPVVGVDLHYSALAYLSRSSSLNVTRVVNNTALTAGLFLTVDDASAVSPILQLTHFPDTVLGVPVGRIDPFNLSSFDAGAPGIQNIVAMIVAENPGEWNNTITVVVRPYVKLGNIIPADSSKFYVDVYENYVNSRSKPSESFLVALEFSTDNYGNQIQVEDVINSRSNLIRWVSNPYRTNPVFVTSASLQMVGGTAGNSTLTDAQVIAGWNVYKDPEVSEANSLINNGYTSLAVQRRMTTIAGSRLDCTAYLDMPSALQQVSDSDNYMRNTLGLPIEESSFAVVSSPDIVARDSFSRRLVSLPPSAFTACCAAATDTIPNGKWLSPAGMERGDIVSLTNSNLEVVDLTIRYTQPERDSMDISGVTIFRYLIPSGIKLWGDSTAFPNTNPLRSWALRRLLNHIESSLYTQMLIPVFDQNTDILWGLLKGLAEKEMDKVLNGRGVSWFEVVCDARNNSSATQSAGDVNVDLYFDPISINKRIRMTAIVTPTGLLVSVLEQDRKLGGV